MLYTVALALAKPFGTLAFRVRWRGKEHVPQTGPLIVCCNHRSVVDPFFVAAALKRQVRFMAKRELFTDHGPVAAWLLRHLGAFEVKRQSADLKSVRTAESILEEGGVLGVFPQGYVIRDNRPFAPKAGAVLIAARAGAPILPAAVYCEGPLKPFRRVTVRFGPVLPGETLLGADRDRTLMKEGSARLAKAINALLEEGY